MKARAFILLLLFAAPHALQAKTHIAAPPPDPNACAPAITVAEKRFALPDRLLGTIAFVESAQPDPVTGKWAPWPWTIDVAGTGYFFPTKAEAIAAVVEFQAAGVKSIDVGCMQINLAHHPDAFGSLEEAFDPAANTMYGARFLSALYRQIGNWPQAAAAYHSQTPEIGQDYEAKVMAMWPLAEKYPDPGLTGRGTVPHPDYSLYTPEFAARVRQMDHDRAHLAAAFGTLTAPAEFSLKPKPILAPRAGPAVPKPPNLRIARYD